MAQNDEHAAYTIPEFCRAHRIGRNKYYELKQQGLAPRETRLGPQKIIITHEAAAAWRAAREAASNPPREAA